MQAVTQPTIGIIRESKNKWERRCSLTPNEVVKLVNNDGIRVLVQPSTTRCYSDEEFTAAGAIIQEDLADASVIFGVKEVPIPDLLADRTYFFFSHTIKAQDYNMPLLDTLLEKKIRMVDFECIRNDQGRLVAFGHFAGVAGTFDFLRGCGEFLLQRSFQTPFIFLGSAYMYEDWQAMKDALSRVSKGIERGALKAMAHPLIFTVTGTGRVASGIVDVLKTMPHEFVAPDKIKEVAENEQADLNKIYILHLGTKDLVALKSRADKPFDKQDYYKNPHMYESVFAERYLPYTSFLVNGVYWEPKYPRVLTIEELRTAQQSESGTKLMGVCDISADYEGSIEFTRKFTSIEEPFLLFDATVPEKDCQDNAGSFLSKIGDAKSGDNNILFHCVDHLPAEMPKEASNHFGSQLYPFIARVVSSDFDKPFEEQCAGQLPPEIANAIITCHGELTPNYTYIAKLREVNEQAAMKAAQEQQAKGKTKGLRRANSFIVVGLEGHLFDTKCFNECIDICEKYNVQFSIVSWQVGNNTDMPSQVSIQMMAKEKELLQEAVNMIEETASKLGIQIINYGDS